jgi:hypothetical protein
VVVAPDYRPSNAAGASVPSDSFFDQVDFIGGVDPDNDWTEGWTTHERN